MLDIEIRRAELRILPDYGKTFVIVRPKSEFKVFKTLGRTLTSDELNASEDLKVYAIDGLTIYTPERIDERSFAAEQGSVIWIKDDDRWTAWSEVAMTETPDDEQSPEHEMYRNAFKTEIKEE